MWIEREEDGRVTWGAGWRDALAAELRRFPESSRRRGEAYWRGARVRSVRLGASGLWARVRGTKIYRAEWSRDAHGRWAGRCSCPLGGACKHLYAVARVGLMLEAVRATADDCAHVAGGDPPGGAPEPEDERALARLREAPFDGARREALLALLGAPSGRPLDASLRIALIEPLAESDADLRCFRVACALRAAGIALPPLLAPYADRPDLAQREADRERRQALGSLAEWAAEPLVAPRKRLRVRLGVVVEAGVPRAWIQAYVDGPKRSAAPCTLSQLERLQREGWRNGPVLAPEEEQLLDLLVRERIGATYVASRPSFPTPLQLHLLLERYGGASLVGWADDLPPAIAERTRAQAGATVRLGHETVRIEPVLEDDAARARLRLRFVWPSGRSLAQSEGLLLPRATQRDPALVLADGAVFRVESPPPRAVLAAFERAGGFDLTPQDTPVLRALVAHSPALRTSLAARATQHRVRTLVLCTLLDDRWLSLRVLAYTGDTEWRPGEAWPEGARSFELRGSGSWASSRFPGDATDEAPEAGDGIPMDVPDPRDVAAVEAWAFATLEAVAGREAIVDASERRLGFVVPLELAGLEAFADALGAGPPAPAFASPELRRLLDPAPLPPARVSVRSSGIDFLEVSAEWEAEAFALEAEASLPRGAEGRFVRLGGRFLRRDAIEQRRRMREALADLGIEVGAGGQRIGALQLAGASPESIALLESMLSGAERATPLRALRQRIDAFRGVPAVPVPRALQAELRPYQRAGLDFLAYASSLGLGALLADDMGLGKTLQALAWLCHLRETTPAKRRGPALVVCPTSVVHGWEREAARFAPSLRVAAFESGKARHAERGDLDRLDLVVTSYALLRRDAEHWLGRELFAAILDEAQHVKNPEAAVSRVAHALSARHRLVLTGTPIENRLLDLWSMLAFASPGLLGPRKRFLERFDRDPDGGIGRRLLTARLRPVLLRRSKREVAPELPERIEERRDAELSPAQRRLYLATLREARAASAAVPESSRDAAKQRIQVLAMLTRLRQICCHPALVGEARGGDGKLEPLREILEPLIAEGHKVLVFSQFVRLLRLVEHDLRARGIRTHVLIGASTGREAIVRSFTEDPDACAFLISLKAGGSGLHLTAASYVVLLDPWWNPAVEAQAIDRAHRIGQTRNVVAYRVVCRGTIEEKILELQAQKRALVQDVLGDETFARSLTRDDLAYLLADPPPPAGSGAL